MTRSPSPTLPRTLPRRRLLAGPLGARALPHPAWGAAAREITWNDLIPPGLPYGEIIGEGEIDLDADTWLPVFDENGMALNEALAGQRIKLPGFIVPLELSSAGVTVFLLVPYVGACIHVPPPPPNQLVLVTTEHPWPSDDLWDPVWATGRLDTSLQTTEIAAAGYALTAEHLEAYEW